MNPLLDSRNGSRTIVRSFRLQRELEDGLEKHAASRNLNVSSLLSLIIRRYLEWDSNTEKYGYVSMPLDMLESLVDGQSDEKLASIGSELGPRLLKESLQFWFKRPSEESFIRYVALTSKYSGVANCEVDLTEAERTITIRHRLGPKWSIFLCNLYQQGMREFLELNPQLDVSASQLVIRWTK